MTVAYIVMVVSPLFFSSNLIFGRGVVDEVAPFTLAFIRWAAVAVALLPFALREREAVHQVLRAHPGRILVLGFLGMWICGAIVYMALARTTATNATLIYTTSPVFILLIEATIFGRSIGLRAWTGALVAFAGIAVIVLGGSLAVLAQLSFNLGDLLILLAAISWAGYSILYRAPQLSALPNMALFCLAAASGTVLLAPFALYEFLTGAQMPVTRTAWWGIAGLVVISSLLAFSAFQYGVRRLGASVAGIFMYLLPPYGVMLAVLLLGERFEPYHAAGIALVMGGVVLATLPGRKRPSQPS